ncbi:Lrp/AsnC family transcriptional regulator [Amycolatopsis sp. NPDC059021]|uniref:Lrp/AsnC family transcriptional regulator n=1 Tax=Amycolatopsis sp. NPDC059021 TaxID=3346704 RepID=UPI0036724C78
MTGARHALDDVDRKLVAALQVNGRASWGQVAAAVGVSERTVVRRAGPLLGGRVVRVTAVRNPMCLPGVIPLVLRLRCKPGRTPLVADAVAALSSALEVLCLEGGDEVYAVVFVPGPREQRSLLLKDLPAMSSVTSWRTHRLLKIFPESLGWRAPLLDEDKAAALTPAVFTPSATPPEQDGVDLRLVDLLAADGRTPYSDLARATGISESTARRKVARLLAGGVIRLATEVDAELLGYRMEAVLWLSVRPAGLARVGGLLAAGPATRLVAVTSGSSNVVATLVARDVDELYEVITGTLGELPDISQFELTPVLRAVKRAGTVLG